MNQSSRRRRIVAGLRKSQPAALAPPDCYPTADVAAMLRSIGIALVEVAQPTPVVEDRLAHIAARYTTEQTRVAVLPTMLIIQIGSAAYEVEATTHFSLQLDAAGRIDEIADLAEAGAITPLDAVAQIAAARALKPRFGAAATVIGYAVTTVGFGMMINPTWASLPGYLFLGLIVGAIVQSSVALPSLTPILPTLSALVVTLLAIWFVADTANDGLLRVITPALVATLPGMSLTTGAMELSGSRIIAGSSRLIYGISQLALLVFGVVIGIHIAGEVAPESPTAQMGAWSLYLAIVVVGLGLSVYLSAPRGSLFWLMAAIAAALLAQQWATKYFSTTHSGFVGAIVSVVFAMVAAQVRSAPPAVVMMLAAFWSLVPGALSFMSVGSEATGGSPDGASLSAAGAAILSIALGTLVGWSIWRTIESRLPQSGVVAGRR